jgi:AraC-like DNA-binding protein
MMGVKMQTADPALHEILAERARERAEMQSTEFIRRVRAALRTAFTERRADIDFVAATLRVSPRTLQRRLEKERAHFQSLLDEERSSLSRIYLEDHDLTLGEIAYRLGYDRLSSFVRAFHRWTGSTPAAWRTRN